MNNKLGLTVILTPLLLAVWLANCAQDARADWEHIPGTEVIGSVHLLESDGIRLYAVGDSGFYLSFDDGYTWRRRDIGRGIDDLFITAIGSGDGAVYVGAIDHGVFRSDDGGNTWEHINEGLHIFDHPKWGRRHGSVYQLLVTGSGMVINVGYHQGTHISSNRGETWHSVYDEWIYPGNKEHNIPDWHFGDSIWSMTEFGGYLWAVYSSSSRIIFRSPDNGETWELLPELEYGDLADWAVLGDRVVRRRKSRLRAMERSRIHVGESQPGAAGRALYESTGGQSRPNLRRVLRIGPRRVAVRSAVRNMVSDRTAARSL